VTELKVFKNELFEVGAKTENNQILFDAEQVARNLGLTTVAKSGNVTVRWSRVNEYLPNDLPQIGKGDFIPEPLVYKLAFKASNDVAEQFQDWLAIEVIPSIRKTGQYVKPLTEKEQLIAAMKLTLESAEEIAVMKEDVVEVKTEIKQVRGMVENQITLDHGEQRRVQIGIASRIYELESDKELRSPLFAELYREIRNRFGVTSYKDIKRKDMMSALNYIEAWVPRRVS
jgi:prophage antirepressor-like protein